MYWESFRQLIGIIIVNYWAKTLQKVRNTKYLKKTFFLFFKLPGRVPDLWTRSCEEGAHNRPRHSIPPLPRVFAVIPAAPVRSRFRRRSGTAGGCEITNSYDRTNWIVILSTLLEWFDHILEFQLGLTQTLQIRLLRWRLF